MLPLVKVLLRKIPIRPTFQCYLVNPASNNACFPSFYTPFFIQNFVIFQPTPSSWDFVAYKISCFEKIYRPFHFLAVRDQQKF